MSDKQNIIETYYLTVYPVKVVVAIGEGLKKTINKRFIPLEEEYKDAVITYPKECDAATYMLRERGKYQLVSLIWAEDPKYFTGSKMAHEATHAALDIFSKIHAEVDMDNQEPFAYLVGAIMKMVNNTFYKFEDKNKCLSNGENNQRP